MTPTFDHTPTLVGGITILSDENGQPRVVDDSGEPIPWVTKVEMTATVSGWKVILHIIPGKVAVHVPMDDVEIREAE